MIGGSLLGDDYPRDTGLLDAERRLHDVAPDAEVASHPLTGRMPDSLLERAREADLLVIGARRGHPVWSALAGWMPLRIASRSRTPVVVVPQHWEPSAGKFVVGVDDDDSSRAAVDFAAREAAVARAPLVFVHTWQTPVAQMEGSVALLASPIEARAGHRKILRDIVQRVEPSTPAWSRFRCSNRAVPPRRCCRRHAALPSSSSARTIEDSSRVPFSARRDRMCSPSAGSRCAWCPATHQTDPRSHSRRR